MSESIYDWTPNKQHRKEPIVRCRDCEMYHEPCIETDWGDYRHSFRAAVHPNGFCAWGVRREDA